MTTAIIGLGTIGKTVARELADGGEPVLLASRKLEEAQALAGQLGANARAASVADAIGTADAVVLTVWFDAMKQVIQDNQDALAGKVVIDPSNPLAPDDAHPGQMKRTLPDGVSSGQEISEMVPNSHYVKAFGTLGGPTLAQGANKSPRIALFYATDDAQAETTIQRLIRAAGFDPVKAGGVDRALDIEVFGRLHEMGGLGKAVTADEARAAVANVESGAAK